MPPWINSHKRLQLQITATSKDLRISIHSGKCSQSVHGSRLSKPSQRHDSNPHWSSSSVPLQRHDYNSSLIAFFQTVTDHVKRHCRCCPNVGLTTVEFSANFFFLELNCFYLQVVPLIDQTASPSFRCQMHMIWLPLVTGVRRSHPTKPDFVKQTIWLHQASMCTALTSPQGFDAPDGLFFFTRLNYPDMKSIFST